MSPLKSHFKTRIENMIKHKGALGFSASSYFIYLHGFDGYCQSKFPNEKELTRELVMSWARKREAETINTLNRRLAALREFARYLESVGEPAYVYPPKMSPSQTRYMPHIFTDYELSLFSEGADGFDEFPGDALHQYIVPVIFRIIYCCGLRPSEGRLITTRDIDFDTGRLYIRESKRHKDRTVVLSDDVLRLCKAYHTILNRTMDSSGYFFPDMHGQPRGIRWLEYQFKKCWKVSGISELHVPQARIYDFRHTFATRWFQDCLDRNDDLYSLLPYLSAYMGHSDFSNTAYYIHLLPDRLKASPSIDWQAFSSLIPEVET